MIMVTKESWNGIQGISRRQFLAGMSAAGIGIATFSIVVSRADGQTITTSTEGLTVADGKVLSGNFEVPIYEAHPMAAGRYPVVLVLPGWNGMEEFFKEFTRRLAKEGFLAITFEPYAREGGVLHLSDPQAIGKVVNPVPDARVMGDLEAILAYIKQHRSAQADRIGVTGFSRGGLYTFLFAAQSREIKATVVWYGQVRPPKTPGVRTAGPIDVAPQINSPVLGLFGETDAGIPVADVKEIEAALKASGKTAEFVVYPGAPHGFVRADRPPMYRAEASTDAWNRCLAWFNKYLKG
jgi:carboxymethylenebutenolidase